MHVLIKALLLSITFLISNVLVAKTGDVRIVIGKNQVALNQAFTIKIIVENEYIKSYSDFPNIPGFKSEEPHLLQILP